MLLFLLSLISLGFAFPLVLRQASTIPDFALTYAPVAWLDSAEQYFPSDIGTQLEHTHPDIDTTPITDPPSPLTLSNLDSLNAYDTDGTDVYLTSNEGIEANPAWFIGVKPVADGSTPGATSCAIITVTKPNSIVDVFYFYFYAYNKGDDVLGTPLLEFGDHVGDWEHTMVRFENGLPQTVYFSQHSSGEAFTYDAVEKYNGGPRPVVYVAEGTHANYAISGNHDHTIPDVNLPAGPLEDHTDQGTLWDPILAAYSFDYDNSTQVFTAYNGEDPINWLNFNGHWGDAQLPDGTSGQVDVFGEAKYSAGPTGPKDKNLGRTAVCEDESGCIIRPILTS